MPDDTGYIKLWRTLRSDWKWDNPLHRSAWSWMLLVAEWGRFNRETGLSRGQLYFSTKWAPIIWGMSDEAARRFLLACEKDKSIEWVRSRGGTLSRGPEAVAAQITHFVAAHVAALLAVPTVKPVAAKLSVPGIITILKYDKWQSSRKKPVAADVAAKNDLSVAAGVAVVGAADVAADEVPSLEGKNKKEEELISPVPVDPQPQDLENTCEKPKRKRKPTEPTGNSLAYNRFVDLFREAQNLPRWKPSKIQAIMMRNNIKQSLENGVTQEVLIECIDGYFQDSYARGRNFPWELFARNPIRYRGTPERQWRDNL